MITGEENIVFKSLLQDFPFLKTVPVCGEFYLLFDC